MNRPPTTQSAGRFGAVSRAPHSPIPVFRLSYPELGEAGNARWVDFSNWIAYLRGKGVERGMQMIRQADPNPGIMMMHPDSYENDLIQDAMRYGGDFHNTGYMGGWWCDKEPALMRGAGLPMSAEPSQGPTLPVHIMGGFANWFAEGVNAIDYFQTLGEVLYHPALKQCFEDHARMYTSVGRFHGATAQVAALYSSRMNNLFGWPWTGRPAADNGQPFFRSAGYPSGFNCRGFFSPMENLPKGPMYESDAVNEGMIARDQVNKYKVIVDTDTCVLDAATIAGIERFARQGGVFVTYGETGRSTPEKPDSWPIDKLTGFRVVDNGPRNGTVVLAPDQGIFTSGSWTGGNFTGHRMAQVAPDARALLLWNDGSVAAGVRPIGKGYIVTTGLWLGGGSGNAYFAGLFQWLKLAPIPGRLETESRLFWRHFVSNNGLYDIWFLRNNNFQESSTGTLVLADQLRPPWMVDLNSGTRRTVTDGRLPVNLPPAEMAIYVTPRADISTSPAAWFDLQRGWWQGTADPGRPFPRPSWKLTMNLTDDWAFQPLDAEHPDPAGSVAAVADDSKWAHISLGIFTLPDYPEVRDAVIRKHFRVPPEWNHGRVILHLPDFRGWSAAYLDGNAFRNGDEIKTGGDHVLALEVKGNSYLVGALGPAWIEYHPEPAARQEINQAWVSSPDLMTWDKPIPLPGEVARGTHALRTEVELSPKSEGRTIVLHVTERSSELHAVVINGRYIGSSGAEMNLNITPWVRPGRKNEIVLVMGGSQEHIYDISLELHRPGSYP